MMNEATITINGQELSCDESRAVRLSVIALAMHMREEKFKNDFGASSVKYVLALESVIEKINQTPVLFSQNTQQTLVANFREEEE